jgi:hypothetical protein
MSDIFTTGEPAYFNEKTTFFAGIQAEVTGNVIGDVQGNIFAPDICVFENGPIIIGALEPTTTPNQTLQVFGGGYFSESIGIGTTNPLSSFVVYGTSEITGMSTFTRGPVIIGAASSTDTPLQILQVTGGTYISGNLGLGNTNPSAKLSVIGNANISGILTVGILSTSNLVVNAGVVTANLIGNVQSVGVSTFNIITGLSTAGISTIYAQNVGIGSDTPTSKLTVVGNTLVTGVTTSQTIIAATPILHVQDRKNAGLDGGTATSGAWRVRDLNTMVSNTITGAGLSVAGVSSSFTLPQGIYDIDAYSTYYSVNRVMSRIVSIGGDSIEVYGSSIYCNGAVTDRSILRQRISLTQSTTFRLQYLVQSGQSGSGLGVDVGSGVANVNPFELYSDVKVIQLSTTP